MPKILLLVLVVFAAWYGWRHLNTLGPQERRRAIWVWGSAALLVIAVILVGTGRMHWVGAALAAAIPLLKFGFSVLFRALPLLGLWQRKHGPSRVRTKGLEVTFNLATGEMDGELFTGPHEGQRLSALDEQQLREQFNHFQANDRQSALLLRAYLLRKGFAGYGSNGYGAGDSNSRAVAGEEMGEEQAFQVLGLKPGASREEIIQAHKRLIQKLHPDRGGNDYLAAMINAAKDRLI
ncbi:MAG: molecular chaperone DnaJ [Porticoccaceae bacterium]|nr:molecular chaperone DnaJ [Porticoccaceae bacterium]